MSSLISSDERREELKQSLDRVKSRIARACSAAGRSSSEVNFLAVTKTFPAEDVALLSDLGVTDMGENRDQEAAAKVAALAGLRPASTVRWHMVGRLQRNKARSVVRWADQVQSVDTVELARALARAVSSQRAPESNALEVLIQVSLDSDPTRGGCPPDSLCALADELTRMGEIKLCGLMAVAPRDADPNMAFDQLFRLRETFLSEYPFATELSAGMSGDLEQAIAHGATRVRVGTALLGGRGLASL